jgi:hypothetical protein
LDLQTLVELLHLKVHTGEDKLARVVTGGYTGDLLSDVIANSSEGCLWITRQVHQNIVAVASLRDLAGIVLIQGIEPPPETVEKARREGLPLLGSHLGAYELSGEIYHLLSQTG